MSRQSDAGDLGGYGVALEFSADRGDPFGNNSIASGGERLSRFGLGEYMETTVADRNRLCGR